MPEAEFAHSIFPPVGPVPWTLVRVSIPDPADDDSQLDEPIPWIDTLPAYSVPTVLRTKLAELPFSVKLVAAQGAPAGGTPEPENETVPFASPPPTFFGA